MNPREPIPMSEETMRRYYELPIPAQIVVRLGRIACMEQYSVRERERSAKMALVYANGMDGYSTGALSRFRAWEKTQEKPPKAKRP